MYMIFSATCNYYQKSAIMKRQYGIRKKTIEEKPQQRNIRTNETLDMVVNIRKDNTATN